MRSAGGKDTSSPPSSVVSSAFESDGKTPKTHGIIKDNSHLIVKAEEKKKKYIAKDFFGRPVVKVVQQGKKRVRADDVENEGGTKKTKGSAKNLSGSKHVLEESQRPIALPMTVFKFVPGYTNAVKRRVNISELL